MRELLGELNAVLTRRLPCVFCTVVETRGSTPQKAGAAMLVYADGSQAGTLGGGCVEAEVKRRALLGLGYAGRSELFTFCLDDDYGWDDGLICGGRMTILAQPLLDSAASYFQQLHELVERGAGYTEAVVIGDALGLGIGDRYLFDADGKPVVSLTQSGTGFQPVIGSGKSETSDSEKWLEACSALQAHEGNDRLEACPTLSAWKTISAHVAPLATRPKPGTKQGIALMPTPPRVTLLIVGGGHVGQAVARLASEVGFEIWVLDDRDRFVSPERFPTAMRRLVGDIGTTLRDLAPQFTSHTFAIIVTRGHNHDEEALYHLARTTCGYVGMIGSKRKIRMIFDDLVAKGIATEMLERVHAPLGYNIGSQTVPEIAVSIVAELIACRNAGGTDAARWSWTPRTDGAKR